MKCIALAAAVFGISVTLQACGGGGDSPSPDNTIPAIAEGDADLSDLVAALKAADLVSTLSGTGPFTVFAPNNGAFEALPNNGALLTYLLNTKETLTKVLQYHVTSGKVMSSDLTNGEKIKMLGGGNVTVDINGSTVKINNATVIKANVEASNGVVHIINEVLVPTDVNLATPTIPELASKDTDLSTLVKAVGAADLAGTLASTAPLTVFAPTNAAFAALNESCKCLDALLANKADLSKVLLYHVLGKEYTAAQVVSGGDESIKTLEGSDVNITISDGKVMINGNTTVTKADLFAVNGVVHVIDKVLVPAGFVPPSPIKSNKVLV
jgi:uncharacterized surface protein with fasciclin (FAS1) repeats